MEIQERIEVSASPEAVWAVISDPYAVVGCVPGASIDACNDDGIYEVSLAVKFGPARLSFKGRVSLELEPAVRRGRLTGHGKDGVGGTRVRTTATFEVAPEPAGSSVTMTGDVEISGRLATFIESGAGIMVKRMSADFAERLAARCAAGS